VVDREGEDALPEATTKCWRLVGRVFTYTLVARHCYDKEELGFWLEEKKEAEGVVADKSLKSLPYQ